jgi:uncharacterized protein (TIGR00369 family)
MNRLNADYVEKVSDIVNQSPYFSLLSMKIIGRQKHTQPFGLIHGGVFASLIDAAAFWSVYCDIPDPEAGLTSVDLKLNYLAPARSGKLIAKGRRIKLGRTLGYAEAEVMDEEGRTLAHGASTLMILPGRGVRTDQPLPPKFVDS